MPVHFVCINVGDKYPDLYVRRLFSMIDRWTDRPVRLTCFTDRKRDLPPQIAQVDCSGWGVPGWFNKLKLLDRAVLDEEFFFLDLALVIKAPLKPVVAKAAEMPQALIAMRDWNYDCFGSMVMWVRPSEVTQGVWDAYAAGRRYPTKTPIDGDQDFIDAYIADAGIERHVGYFPQEWFVSYKVLRKLRTKDRLAAAQMLSKGVFLKFHGPPKMHQFLDPWQHARILLRSKPMRFFSYWNYLRPEVKEWWR